MAERDAAVLMKTLIKAMIHCHANDIMHRDIKLENIMFGNKEKSSYCKKIMCSWDLLEFSKY